MIYLFRLLDFTNRITIALYSLHRSDTVLRNRKNRFIYTWIHGTCYMYYKYNYENLIYIESHIQYWIYIFLNSSFFFFFFFVQQPLLVANAFVCIQRIWLTILFNLFLHLLSYIMCNACYILYYFHICWGYIRSYAFSCTFCICWWYTLEKSLL